MPYLGQRSISPQSGQPHITSSRHQLMQSDELMSDDWARGARYPLRDRGGVPTARHRITRLGRQERLLLAFFAGEAPARAARTRERPTTRPRRSILRRRRPIRFALLPRCAPAAPALRARAVGSHRSSGHAANAARTALCAIHARAHHTRCTRGGRCAGPRLPQPSRFSTTCLPRRGAPNTAPTFGAWRW
eukprot:7375997-Prymnesium_polylepis.1